MRQPDRTADEIIARIATRGHGVTTRRELLDAGVTPGQLRHRLRAGALLREHPGVYRVGHRAPDVLASYLAAVLACGDGALLCGRAAAHLYGLLKGPSPPPEVIAPKARRLAGVTVTRSRRFLAVDATSWTGIQITTVPRTIVDLAAILDPQELARACHEAGVRFRTAPAHVETALARQPNSPGATTLRSVLHGDVHVTLSVLESRFLGRLRDAGLPLPRTNRPVGGRYVDCRWPELRLTVELDSYRYHGSRHAWENDRRREREAYARGDEFRRYTYGDVLEDPRAMLAELRERL